MTYSKYRARKTTVDGIKFDSRHEADAYCQFRLLQRAGKISELKLQVPFELQPSFKMNGKTIRAIKYVADFTYYDDKGIFHVVDAKGIRTDVYKLKKKLFQYKYQRTIEEI